MKKTLTYFDYLANVRGIDYDSLIMEDHWAQERVYDQYLNYCTDNDYSWED